MVIVSIDENLLRDVCLREESENNDKFIVDGAGNLVSSKNDDNIGEQIIEWSDNIEQRKQAYLDYREKSEGERKKYLLVDVVHDDNLGWDIVEVSDRNEIMGQLETQQKMIFITILIVLVSLFFIIKMLIRLLMCSINNLVEVMKRVGQGEMDARVDITEEIPTEIRMISCQFNITLDELQDAMKKEKETAAKQRNAEIAVLEAQINPHFLYNTLDTINWMAIEKSEFEISNSITSLAAILRYGLDKSNGIVPVRKEMEWLKKYLFLQQTRMKESFECEISVMPEVKELKIHKMLLQPFVENTILHGFDGKKGVHILKIEMELCGDVLQISLWDNGKGMPRELVDNMNRGEFPDTQERDCIGMKNAITRIAMYYGENAKVQVESELGIYTRIKIAIPQIERYQEV